MQLQAKKSLGQHFLVDHAYLARILRSVDPKPSDWIIEIGPGTGLLTRQLLSRRLERLIAIEVDGRAIPQLQREFGEDPRCEVVHADFLQTDLTPYSEPREKKLRVVGNIPYNITSPIVFRLFENRALLRDATLLMQKEVAERLIAKPRTKAYGIPTVFTELYAEATLLFFVPRGAFRPIPNVDSAVIHLDFNRDYFERRGTKRSEYFKEESFKKLVKGLFHMRRKTIRNNLKLLYSAKLLDRLSSDVRWNPVLSERVEELSLDQLLDLHNHISTLETEAHPGV